MLLNKRPEWMKRFASKTCQADCVFLVFIHFEPITFQNTERGWKEFRLWNSDDHGGGSTKISLSLLILVVFSVFTLKYLQHTQTTKHLVGSHHAEQFVWVIRSLSLLWFHSFERSCFLLTCKFRMQHWGGWKKLSNLNGVSFSGLYGAFSRWFSPQNTKRDKARIQRICSIQFCARPCSFHHFRRSKVVWMKEETDRICLQITNSLSMWQA